MAMKIPQIIHQIWIGDKPAPIKQMNTWKEKNPDFEYIFWNEQEFQRRNIVFECQEKIDIIQEINGKADIIRWELLYKFGGVFIDADSICIEPIDDYFMCKPAFASYENEEVRKGLVATGTMGFPPNHQLCRDIIDWIKSDESTTIIIEKKAWFSVGPGVLTRFLDTGKYPDFAVFPSHCFLPIHFEGKPYTGHKKVYAHQYWGSNYQLYGSDYFSKVELPESLLPPKKWVSVILFSSENTTLSKVKDCLNSIKCQRGHFGIEVIWFVAPLMDSNEMRVLVESFEKTSRFTKMNYFSVLKKEEPDVFIQNCQKISTGSFIFLMDINYVMSVDRIQKQMDFLEQNPEKMVCGSTILDGNNSQSKKTTLCLRKDYDITKIETDSIVCLPESLVILT